MLRIQEISKKCTFSVVTRIFAYLSYVGSLLDMEKEVIYSLSVLIVEADCSNSI